MMDNDITRGRKVLTCQIISIGDEILIGNTVDTNSNFLALNLTKLGIKVDRILTIPDDIDIIVSDLKKALKSHDLVITTGGLGPTWDDSTVSAVAKFLDTTLVLDEKAFTAVKKAYSRLYQERLLDSPEITSERKKMAMIPLFEDMNLISNTAGVAPGLHVRISNSHLLVLPGVPREMKSMFTYISKLVSSESKLHYYEKKIEIGITAESTLAPFLKLVRDRYPECYIKSTPSSHDRTALPVIISSMNEDRERAIMSVEKAIAFLREEISHTAGTDKIKQLPVEK